MRGHLSVLTDAEMHDFFRARAERLRLECCVCGESGWRTREPGQPFAARRVFIPSCECEDHAVCLPCCTRLATDAVTAGARVLHCPFPYSERRCAGKVRRQHWRSVLPMDVVVGGWPMLCSACAHVTPVADACGRWSCAGCGRTACGACDAEECVCGHSSSRVITGWSRCFSRSDGSGMPLRRKDVTPAMVAERLRSMREHAPWLHAACPTCAAPLHKSSACNDLHHCGSTHTCNWCLARSFPWESGIHGGHWHGSGGACPRWDHDVPWLPCRDGECSGQAFGGECRDSTHAMAVRALHAARWAAAISAVRADVGDIVFQAGHARGV
jgi:hypothetical protein